MANRKVSVYKYINLGNGNWRYVRPVMNKNHTYSRESVWFKGKQERHPEGNFYLGWNEGKKKCWLTAGPDPDRVTGIGALTVSLHAAVKIQEARLLRGETPSEKPKEQQPATDFSTAIALFLSDFETGGRKGLKPARPSTVKLFRQTLTEFAGGLWHRDKDGKSKGGWLTFPGMEQMRRDIFKYREWLEERQKAPGTIGKKIDRLNQFIRIELGLEKGKGPVKRSDFEQWGYYDDEDDVEIYTDEQVAKFFNVCDAVEHLLFSVYFESGFRAQEVANITWSDVDVVVNKLKVTRKSGFSPKTRRSIRSVTVSKLLIARLKACKETSSSEYVFSNYVGHPLSNGDMLTLCKEIAARAGLSPADFWLHKWRHTSATTFLRNSASAAGALKMLMARLGHKNITTTQAYLGKLPQQEEQNIVDKMAVMPAIIAEQPAALQ